MCARVRDGCILCFAAKVTMSDNRPLRLIKGPSQRSLLSSRCPVFFLRPASFSPPLLSASPTHSTPHHAIIHSSFAFFFFPFPCGELLVSTQLSLPPFLFVAQHSLIRRAAAPRPALGSRHKPSRTMTLMCARAQVGVRVCVF